MGGEIGSDGFHHTYYVAFAFWYLIYAGSDDYVFEPN